MAYRLNSGKPFRPPLKREAPYRRAVRLALVGGMAVVVAAVGCAMFAREYLALACVVSPVLWIGIALLLETRERWVYLVFGALSPCLGVPAVLFLQCCRELLPGPARVIRECGTEFLWALVASPLFLFLSPVGLVMGAVAHTFMRRDARI